MKLTESFPCRIVTYGGKRGVLEGEETDESYFAEVEIVRQNWDLMFRFCFRWFVCQLNMSL